MENITLFVITVFAYYVVWFLWESRERWTERIALSKEVKRIALVMLLALPININGDVFTIAGNAVAEKSVLSLFSVYQWAGNNALSLVNIGYQKSGYNSAAIIGFNYQESGHNSLSQMEIGFQKANNDAINGVGVVYQQALRDTSTFFSIAYQRAGEDATIFTGLPIYQTAGNIAVAIVAFAPYQKAKLAITLVGLAGYQESDKSAKVPLALALYQRVGEKTRVFAAFSSLTK